MLETYGMFVQLVALMVVLSIAVERVVAITTNVTDFDSRIKNPKLSNALKQLIAAVAGGVIYAMNSDAHIAYITQHFFQVNGAIIVGLLASGGSGFWNGVLKIMSATSSKIDPKTVEISK